MLIGSIYALLNPAFPEKLKLGRTTRTADGRARELSRHTAVPDSFVLIYDELVADCEKAEHELHERFADKRVRKSKEFFRVSAKEAVLAIQEIARRHPVPNDVDCIRVPILPDVQQRFGLAVRPDLVEVNLVQMPEVSALEVITQRKLTHSPQRRLEEIMLGGMFAAKYPNETIARRNAAQLVALDEYSFINVTDLLTPEAVREILARESRRSAGGYLCTAADFGPPLVTITLRSWRGPKPLSLER